MTWFKVDDSFWSHPKTMMLSPEAVALWVRAGSWSCQQLTDGLIAERSLPLFAAQEDAVDELVDAGFWDAVEGGYEFHDWDDYQEKSETVKARRAAARERMRVVRANRERTQHERAMEQNAKFAKSSPNPDPTRPDPTRPSTSSDEEVDVAPKKPARRKPERPLPDDWRPNDAAVAYARSEGVDVAHEYGQFRNHVAANDRRQRDWDAAFRTWLGNAKKFGPQSKPTPTQRAQTTVALATDLDLTGLKEIE